LKLEPNESGRCEMLACESIPKATRPAISSALTHFPKLDVAGSIGNGFGRPLNRLPTQDRKQDAPGQDAQCSAHDQFVRSMAFENEP
jgi:hypothetical protein